MTQTQKLIALAALVVALVVTWPGMRGPIESGGGVSAETRAAIKTYLKSTADSFDTLAAETKAGKYKTVLEAGAASEAKEKQARDAFKQAMAKIMEPKLGSEDLPKDAPATFSSIADGFRGAAK